MGISQSVRLIIILKHKEASKADEVAKEVKTVTSLKLKFLVFNFYYCNGRTCFFSETYLKQIRLSEVVLQNMNNTL